MGTIASYSNAKALSYIYLEEAEMPGPVTIASHKKQLNHVLDEIYDEANSKYIEQAKGKTIIWMLSENLISLIDQFWNKARGNADSAITNLTTCLISKAVEPDVDCRYHRQPKKPMPQPPSGSHNYFSGRTISEQIVAPWLKNRDFVTSYSGWQTRTFERPKPYTLDYEENISHIKKEFLGILDSVQNGEANIARDALAYLFFKQLELRENQKIQLTIPNISNILTIISFFQKHFHSSYSQRGTARLPVLAIHAIYACVMPEMERYYGCQLAPLEKHEAADARTGAVGDIEIFDEHTKLFEAFEIKHEITIDKEIIRTAFDKFRSHPTLKRYYILTTAEACGGQDPESIDMINRIRNSHGAEVIVNGVLPTIKYYLRLLKNPASIFPLYISLLASDQSVTYEHRQKWNDVVIG